MSIPVYQLEVKLPSINGEPQTQVIRLKSDNATFIGDRLTFPETGMSGMLYVATDEGRLYVWYNDTYTIIGGGSSIDVLDGGLVE